MPIEPANENQPKGQGGCCPICSKPTPPAYKPFCSKRCADVDLNRWLTGGYAIPVADDGNSPGSADEEEQG
jgi:endogenous inhibitor of DNA gyrase (YacG/DUF329 family)